MSQGVRLTSERNGHGWKMEPVIPSTVGLSQRMADCAADFFEDCSGVMDGKPGDEFDLMVTLTPIKK